MKPSTKEETKIYFSKLERKLFFAFINFYYEKKIISI